MRWDRPGSFCTRRFFHHMSKPRRQSWPILLLPRARVTVMFRTTRTIRPMGTFRGAAALGVVMLWCAPALAEQYTVPLLVAPAGASGQPQGVLRILNATAESGAVQIHAVDDAGTRSWPAAFTLGASAAAEFTAMDLQSGNAALGLAGGIGTGVGDARLEIETDLDIVPMAFVRASDGTLSAMHDTVRGAQAGDDSGGYTYEVPVFNLSTEMVQASRLRLINPGDSAAAIAIAGRDDTGALASGGDVTLTLAAGASKTLTAQQLEAGDESVAGRLGAGAGKWRLTVSSDRPLEVANIVVSTAGYWSNLSTTAVRGAAPPDLDAFTERFGGREIFYDTDAGILTFTLIADGRFTETGGSGGIAGADMGDYGYAAVGREAGRLTLEYDDGGRCRANLYFSTRTSGWFASRCTATGDPDGYRTGGTWSLADGEVDGGGGAVMKTGYGVDDALPGVPTSGAFTPTITDGGSILRTGGGTTILLINEAYFELSDGTRYTCTAPLGCRIANGTVTAGTVTGLTAGAGEVSRFPECREGMTLSPGQSCTYPGTDTTFVLSGLVTDSRSAGLAVAGATARIESGPWAGQREITGADGRYRFENLAGTTTVTVTGRSSYPARTIDVTMDTDRTVDFVLEHNGRPPFGGTVWITPNLITPSDPTSLIDVTYVGRGARELLNPHADTWEVIDTYLFDVQYAGQIVEFQVHSDFHSSEAARYQVNTYAPALGRLPAVLLSGAREVEISIVDHGFQANGGSGIFHIYTPDGEELLENGFLEEVLLHEGGHVSLDPGHENSAHWLAAQRADGVFVSDYARDHPGREDVAESILPYFALRYRPDRLTEAARFAIAAAIPNRLLYFDEQGFDMSPYTRMESTVPAADPNSLERPRSWQPFESPYIGLYW
ncbi:MAG: hypothetical protein F4089_08820 [Gammaproteobacteria bacterium]|nr:hypothetical protein [Gammaproteobacteria bacterium]